MAYDKNTTRFYKRIPASTLEGGANSTAYYKLEFLPGSATALSAFTEVEFPNNLIMNDELSVKDNFESEQPIGLHETAEMSFNLNLLNFTDDYADVATWILEEGYYDSGADWFYPNNWILKRVQKNAVEEIIYWGCQINSGGYNEFEISQNVMKYTVKTADILRSTLAQIKINWVLQLIAWTITFENLASTKNDDRIFGVFAPNVTSGATRYTCLNYNKCATIGTANSMRFVNYTDFYDLLKASIQLYIRLTTRRSAIDFDMTYYPFDFWSLYTQKTDGTTATNANITADSTYLLWDYDIDGTKVEGIANALLKYENVYDMFKSQYETGVQRCYYSYSTSEIRLDSEMILKSTAQALEVGQIVKDSIKWKDRGGYIGSATSHNTEIADGDLENTTIQDTTAINNQNSYENELAFDNNNLSVATHWNSGDFHILENEVIKGLALYDIRTGTVGGYTKFALKLHDYCKLRLSDTETVDANLPTVANYFSVCTSKDKFNGYILERQQNSGCGYVWAKAIKRLFSLSNMAELELTAKIETLPMKVGTALNIDLNDLLDVTFLTKYPTYGIITGYELDIIKELATYKILLIE